jgi:hypothetical protein
MKDIKDISMVPLTRPAGAGHPLPLGEGSARYTLLILATQRSFERPTA